MFGDNLLELTSKGPIDIKSIVPSLCGDASLATVAFIKENRKQDIIAYNAFLVEAAVTASTDVSAAFHVSMFFISQSDAIVTCVALPLRLPSRFPLRTLT
jgi:hypothetical protein